MNHSATTKIRRLTVLLLVILLTACLAGCKDNHAGSTESTPDPLPSASTAPSTQAPPETTTEAPTVETTVAPTEAPTEPAQTEPTSGTTMGTVTASELNIRKKPGMDYEAVDYYVKGDRVEILEIQGAWGRTDKGWVKMQYIDTTNSVDITDEDKEPAEEAVNDGNTTPLGYGVVNLGTLNVRTGPGTKYEDVDDVSLGERYAYYQKSGNWVRLKKGWVSMNYFYMEGDKGEGAGKGTVTASELNVRKGPGKDFESVDALKKGASVKILAQVNDWGYTGEGWVSMDYVTMEGSISTQAKASGVVTGSDLNIREEPGTDAKVVGSYDKGDKVEILETKGNWGRTDKGWISLTYVKMNASTGTGVITGSDVNIRKEAGTDAKVVGSYDKGDKVKILEVKGNWGRTDKGWVSLTYVKMDS